MENKEVITVQMDKEFYESVVLNAESGGGESGGDFVPDNNLYIRHNNLQYDKDYYIGRFDTNAIKVIKTNNSERDIVIFDEPPKKMETETFGGSKVCDIQFPDSVEEISDYCFYQIGDYLQNVEFGANLKRIGEYAFGGCYKCLKPYTLMPSGIEYIGPNAFPITSIFDFSKAKQIPTIFGANEYGSGGSFAKEDNVFIVPDELYDEWIIAEGWDYYANLNENGVIINQIIKYSDWLVQD